MPISKMTKDEANKVYDILVNMGGASSSLKDRNDFLYHHVESENGCDEYRFGGKLGFGGKYYSGTNTVDCYSEEHSSDKHDDLIEGINSELSCVFMQPCKITYLGNVLDPYKEHELFSENEHGFIIHIKYTESSWYPTKNESAFNFTEFHWRYTDIFNVYPSDGVAFESDVHGTGFTRKINTIESVTIELADKIYDLPFSN